MDCKTCSLFLLARDDVVVVDHRDVMTGETRIISTRSSQFGIEPLFVCAAVP